MSNDNGGGCLAGFFEMICVFAGICFVLVVLYSMCAGIAGVDTANEYTDDFIEWVED